MAPTQVSGDRDGDMAFTLVSRDGDGDMAPTRVSGDGARGMSSIRVSGDGARDMVPTRVSGDRDGDRDMAPTWVSRDGDRGMASIRVSRDKDRDMASTRVSGDGDRDMAPTQIHGVGRHGTHMHQHGWGDGAHDGVRGHPALPWTPGTGERTLAPRGTVGPPWVGEPREGGWVSTQGGGGSHWVSHRTRLCRRRGSQNAPVLPLRGHSEHGLAHGVQWGR